MLNIVRYSPIKDRNITMRDICHVLQRRYTNTNWKCLTFGDGHQYSEDICTVPLLVHHSVTWVRNWFSQNGTPNCSFLRRWQESYWLCCEIFLHLRSNAIRYETRLCTCTHLEWIRTPYGELNEIHRSCSLLYAKNFLFSPTFLSHFGLSRGSDN